MFKRVSLAAAAVLIAAPARAQDAPAKIDSIFSFATPDTPGCVVGVSQNGNVVVNRAYGLGDVDRRVPLSQTSIFDIGSTQKQFVAAAILLLVEDGRVSLSDDIRKYFPELPDYGHKVTVDHLLTHTGGIRDWTGLLPMSEGDPDVLALILRQRALNFTPGEEWSYSNSGYVLLKEIVARVSGMSFADFARQRLFDPLGMKSSAYVADILQGTGDRALGYQKHETGWKQFMRLGNNRGGGAVISTAGDLLIWNDALTNGRLGVFVTGKLQEEARLTNGRKLSYARGLNVNQFPGSTVVSHSGGAAGYSTWLGRVMDQGLSVAVLCNFDPVSATGLANRVIDHYVPLDSAEVRKAAQARATTAVAERAALTGVDLNGRAGVFFKESTGEPLELMVNNGRLGFVGGPPLVAVAADRFRTSRATLFFMSEDAFELHFPSADRVELKSMEGKVTRYRRAQPWTPTAAELEPFEGRYNSDELGSVFEIVPGAAGVVMRFESSPEKAIQFAPVERDMFQFRRMTIRFHRDAGGKVVAFDYSNPLVRDVRITRVGDRKAGVAASAPTAPVAASQTPAKAAAEALPLDSFTGEYELAAGRHLAITLENGSLHGQPSGGEKLRLTYVSGTTFAAEGSGITLTFVLGADGRATAALMKQGGRERTLRKVQ